MMKKNKTRFLTSKKLKEAWKAVSLSIMLMLVVNMSYLGVFFVANDEIDPPLTKVALAADWSSCGFQCEANDVTVQEFKLTDLNGNELTSCNPGDTVSAKIMVKIKNNSQSSRNAVVLMGDIYQGDNKLISLSTAVYSGEVSGKCVKGFIRGGENRNI